MIPDFAAKLALALKAVSLSRGRLAAELGLDKSVVSRWANGINAPSEENLTRLTRLIAARRPGFTMLDWDGGIDALARQFGADMAAQPPAGDRIDEWLPLAALQSGRETYRDGSRYPGLYVQIRERFANSGVNFAELVPIWRQGDQLWVRFDGAGWAHSGRIFVLGHQLFMVTEDKMVSEGMWMQVMNGVADGAALSLDGILMSVPHDRNRAPSAAMCLMLRIADLAHPDREPPPALLADYQARIAALCEAGRVAELSGPEIMAHVANATGVVRADGIVDRVLRAPASRGMTCGADAPDPVVARAVARWRSALDGRDRGAGTAHLHVVAS